MDKLTNREEDIVSEFLDNSKSAEFTQEILRIIGEENWTRGILSDTSQEHLTIKQLKLYESLGGGYSVDEVSKDLFEHRIERQIRKKLKSNGITAYLYENEDYLSALREGQEIFEGLDVEQIKNDLLME